MFTATTLAKPTSNNDAAGHDDAVDATHDAPDANDATDAAAASNRTGTRCSAAAAASNTHSHSHTPTTTHTTHLPTTSTAASTTHTTPAGSHHGGSRRFTSDDVRNGSLATTATPAGLTTAATCFVGASG